MSTAELKEIIDQRMPEERKWMAAYLLDECSPFQNCARQRRSYLSSRDAEVLSWRGVRQSRESGECRNSPTFALFGDSA